MIARIGVIRKMNTSVEAIMVAVHAMRWLERAGGRVAAQFFIPPVTCWPWTSFP
jgi:hypothetical protein